MSIECRSSEPKGVWNLPFVESALEIIKGIPIVDNSTTGQEEHPVLWYSPVLSIVQVVCSEHLVKELQIMLSDIMWTGHNTYLTGWYGLVLVDK